MAALSGKLASEAVLSDRISTRSFRRRDTAGGMSMRSAMTGRFGLTIIAFIGSVFSPYYRKSGRNIPLDHSCLNVALYGKRGARWVMTERGQSDTVQHRDALQIGPSSMRWDNDRLIIEIEERDIRLGIPWRRRVAGQIVLTPEVLNDHSFKLDADGQHHWHTIAPRARIDVRMERARRDVVRQRLSRRQSRQRTDRGRFRDWHWSRAHAGEDVAVIYEGNRRDGSHFGSALRFDKTGHPARGGTAAGRAPARDIVGHEASDPGGPRPCIGYQDLGGFRRSMPDSTLDMRIFGKKVTAMQESISLDRLVNPVIQFMLPYKMPRE